MKTTYCLTIGTITGFLFGIVVGASAQGHKIDGWKIDSELNDIKKVSCLDLVVEFNVTRATLDNIMTSLNHLSIQRGCRVEFAFLPRDVDPVKDISIDFRRRSIREIINIALNDTLLEYKVMGSHTEYVTLYNPSF
jgi:hypothetical protein